MTTPPIQTLTDELLGEIERKAQSKQMEGFALVHNLDCVAVMSLITELRTLRAENASLKAESATWEMRACKEATANVDLKAENAELRKDAEKRIPLYEAVDRACGNLPDGWQINLCMENGAGWIELYDDVGVHLDDFPTNNERLDYTLNDAIDAAMEQAK